LRNFFSTSTSTKKKKKKKTHILFYYFKMERQTRSATIATRCVSHVVIDVDGSESTPLYADSRLANEAVLPSVREPPTAEECANNGDGLLLICHVPYHRKQVERRIATLSRSVFEDDSKNLFVSKLSLPRQSPPQSEPSPASPSSLRLFASTSRSPLSGHNPPPQASLPPQKTTSKLPQSTPQSICRRNIKGNW
jgi:hypothetical protein